MIPGMTPHPQSNTDLLDRSLSAVWHPCSQMKHYEHFPLLPIASGSGVWLYDYDKKRYLDAVSSWWVNLFGHSNPRINAALREQLETLCSCRNGCANWHLPALAIASMLPTAHRPRKSHSR
jgi:adenosylmethionine-8-amino-7-oxononanoate aminotransferase